LYQFSIDIWSVGCILYEMVACAPLFAGGGQLGQIMRLLAVIGTPREDECPGLKERFERCTGAEMPAHARGDLAAMMAGGDPLLSDLVPRMLRFDPMRRISAKEALRHPYFDDVPDEIRRQCIACQPG
jgi:serine/threonine protein kinase